MKHNILFLIGIFVSFNASSQGKVIGKDIHNKYEKTLRLISLYNERYYKNFSGDSASIKNGQYLFKTPNYSNTTPIPFRFLFQTEKNKVFEVSDIFYISKETNIISFDSETKKIVLDKNDDSYQEVIDYNRYMAGYLSKKNKLDSVQAIIYKKKDFKVDRSTIDSLQTLHIDLDHYEESELLNLSKKTPKSYLLFWKLVEKFESKGFRPEYLTIFNNLHSSIKKSSVGKIFSEDLNIAEKISLGSIFPDLIFQNKKIRSSLGRKYTVIDFWFSYCQACLEEMPKYKEMYSKYKGKGFEIINISIDRSKDVGKWEKVIKEKELNWIHYLDENGMKAKYYNINKYPTKFLLDSSGKIIKIDIAPEDLETFLSENLKD